MHGEPRVDGVLLDLLMAVMDSPAIWADAAGDPQAGLAWRDAVTAAMVASGRYVAYEDLVADAAPRVGLPPSATSELLDRWLAMEPWPDAGAVSRFRVPYGFVTNCSARLAQIAVARSGLEPQFAVSAETLGWFKPNPHAYREGCRLLGTVPGRTAFVAGAPYDAEGAHRAGLQAWLVVRRANHRSPVREVISAGSLEEVVAGINDRDGEVGT